MATIILGVSASIAAYKAADLCSKLVGEGHTVYPILTPGASKFIAPLTFTALSGNPCSVDMFDEPFPGEIAHIHYAKIADLILVVPASMDIMAKLAHGEAPDMLTAAISATKAPVLLAPGMNSVMWQSHANQANLRKLNSFGYNFVDPVSGRLACRTDGVGKMADVALIHKAVDDLLGRKQLLAGKHVVVTAGPTREPIDPVRYITNRSSGKMGYAIAEAAAARGAEVTLISGPVAILPTGEVRVESVETAQEMFDATVKAARTADIVIAAAAVADYRPAQPESSKIKKLGTGLDIALVRTADILAQLGISKPDGQILVGFAAETDDIETNALAKLKSKNLDFIVANDITKDGAGFDHDTNIVTIYASDGTKTDLPLSLKREVAEHILDLIIARESSKPMAVIF
jgi:phosphopantothenoylcysteine decarboxylase/phosphopantothenate--cysteine ligase